jgi:REP element-mobilizing transposase RayT
MKAQISDIFYGNKNKNQFLDYLTDAAKKFRISRIRIFAYTVMNNHYHLVLENSSGKMSEFMKWLNGQYGAYYREVTGGKGQRGELLVRLKDRAGLTYNV